MERFISGESKKIFKVNSHNLLIGLTIDGKHAWQQEEEEQKRRFQYCTDDSGIIVYFRALQGHSGRNLIDPSLAGQCCNSERILQHIYHIGCAFNLHAIINNGLIPGGQIQARDRQYLFFLPVDPRDKSHKDPERLT